jgi:hypothetical protein
LTEHSWRFFRRHAFEALLTLCGVLVALPLGAASGPTTPETVYSPEKSSFTVKFKDEASPYRIMSVFVLPDEAIALEVQDPLRRQHYTLRTSAGAPVPETPTRWQWRAPSQPGLYTLQFIDDATGDMMMLSAFVMIPYSRLNGEVLNGYRIGRYPSIPLKQLSIYKPPRGFIEVTEQNEATFLSPHFQLRDFICRQDGGYPKYVVLQERLLLKLELILEKVNEKGYSCCRLHIMSGYRTPYYNQLIDNGKYSHHLWGGAADIFIDENPTDDMMDDLNGDGHINYRDAEVLYDIVEELYGNPWYEQFLGGLGLYKKTHSHGPFVHIDVRGFRVRWGD